MKIVGNSRLWLLMPLPALIVGIITMACNGVPVAVWSQNIATAGLCILFCVTQYRAKPFHFKFETLTWPYLLAAPAAIGLTFLNDGLHGVHRWVLIGPARLHTASIVLPLLLVRLAMPDRGKTAFAWTAALLTAVLLILQPDLSEACAFTCAVISILIARAEDRRLFLFFGSFFALACFATAWAIPDGLPSVANVEGIIQMAAQLHPILAVCGIIGVAILPLPFLYEATAGHRAKRIAGLAVAAYFLGIILISMGTGRYPVIFLGYGASPLIGYYLAYRLIRILGCQEGIGAGKRESFSLAAPKSDEGGSSFSFPVRLLNAFQSFLLG